MSSDDVEGLPCGPAINAVDEEGTNITAALVGKDGGGTKDVCGRGPKYNQREGGRREEKTKEGKTKINRNHLCRKCICIYVLIEKQ